MKFSRVFFTTPQFVVLSSSWTSGCTLPRPCLGLHGRTSKLFPRARRCQRSLLSMVRRPGSAGGQSGIPISSLNPDTDGDGDVEPWEQASRAAHNPPICTHTCPPQYMSSCFLSDSPRPCADAAALPRAAPPRAATSADHTLALVCPTRATGVLRQDQGC
jgi:hypothetical protein